MTKRSTSSNTATNKNVLTQLVTSLAQAPLTQSMEATNSAPKDDDKYQKLSDQVKQLQKQIQRVNPKNSVAAYQPVPTGRPAAASNFNYRPRKFIIALTFNLIFISYFSFASLRENFPYCILRKGLTREKVSRF